MLWQEHCGLAVASHETLHSISLSGMAATYFGSSTEPKTQYEHMASPANRSFEKWKTFQLACQFVKLNWDLN